MKKVLLFFVTAVLTANFVQAQITFGARAGVSFTGNGQYGGFFDFDNDSFLPKIGFQIGGLAEFALSDALSIQPGLLITSQGDKFVKKTEISLLGVNVSASQNDKVNMTYIRIPVNAQYKINLGEIAGSNADLIIHLGPYFAYAIGGKIKNEQKINEKTEKNSTKIKFGSGDDCHYKPLDFGLGAGVGLQIDNRRVIIEFNRGLTNISNVSAYTATNWSFVVGVIFLFGK